MPFYYSHITKKYIKPTAINMQKNNQILLWIKLNRILDYKNKRMPKIILVIWSKWINKMEKMMILWGPSLKQIKRLIIKIV